jgi:hypothetical protein
VEPDWTRLRELGNEVTRLQDTGAFDRAAFDRMFAAARTAARGHSEFLEFVVNAADPAWLE